MPRLLTGLEPDSRENRKAIARGERQKQAAEEGLARVLVREAAVTDDRTQRVLRCCAADMGRTCRRAIEMTTGFLGEKAAFEYAKAAGTFANAYFLRGGTVEAAQADERWRAIQ